MVLVSYDGIPRNCNGTLFRLTLQNHYLEGCILNLVAFYLNSSDEWGATGWYVKNLAPPRQKATCWTDSNGGGR